MTDNLPPLPKPARITAVQFCDDGLWFTAEQMQAYARAAIEASRAAVPAGFVTDLGFRWDCEKQHHVPQLVIEFEPVPANSPCDAKGWADRDRAAKLFSTAPQPVAQPVQPSERWHVGDSAFESWFSDYSPTGKGDKQRARDAYAAGMGELAQVTQAKPEQAAQPRVFPVIVREAGQRLELWLMTRDENGHVIPFGATGPVSMPSGWDAEYRAFLAAPQPKD